MLIDEESGKVRKLPTLVFLHDGLFVAGNANHTWAAELARSIPCMVISVEYSLAPEHSYREAVMDAVDAMMWGMGATDIFFTDVDRFGFVGIEAGATVAAAAALHVRTACFSLAYLESGIAGIFRRPVVMTNLCVLSRNACWFDRNPVASICCL
jgi:acetyl esterase/lipase